MSVHGDHGSGAAKRRRDRRLRMHWRHEQLTQMALAAALHHSRDVGPVRTARAGVRAREELHGYAPEDAPPSPPQAAGAQHFAMDAGEDVWGGTSRQAASTVA